MNHVILLLLETREEKYQYLGESKVLQYFGYVRDNLGTPDTFCCDHEPQWTVKC